jgi:hypothetical protein
MPKTIVDITKSYTSKCTLVVKDPDFAITARSAVTYLWLDVAPYTQNGVQ